MSEESTGKLEGGPMSAGRQWMISGKDFNKAVLNLVDGFGRSYAPGLLLQFQMYLKNARKLYYFSTCAPHVRNTVPCWLAFVACRRNEKTGSQVPESSGQISLTGKIGHNVLLQGLRTSPEYLLIPHPPFPVPDPETQHRIPVSSQQAAVPSSVVRTVGENVFGLLYSGLGGSPVA